MTLVAAIRHMPTGWSRTGRLQGRADPPLDPAVAPHWVLPPELAGFRLLSSPLRRAVETAARFHTGPATIDPRLTEMAWGEWEGFTLTELRARLGPALAAAEDRGLDFRAPGGESPRDVQARLAPLLREIAADGRPVAAVTHKGVIRALFASASGWDMRGKPPARLSWEAAHLFRLDRDGTPRVVRLNLALAAAVVA